MLDTDDLYTADEVRAELTATARDAFLKGQASERRRVTDLFRFAVLANGSGAKMLKALEALDGRTPEDEPDPEPAPGPVFTPDDDADGTDTWTDGDEAALLLAAIDEAQHAIAAGDDPQPVLDALFGRRGTIQKAGAWQHDKHPRDKAGRFISKDAIADAKTDPKKAAELRDRVKPEDAQKLDDAISGKTDLGKTAKRQKKDLTAEKREVVRANRKTAMELVNKIRDQHARGDGVSADDLHALIPHLSTMSHDELSNVRTQLFRLGAQFGGTRKLQERANKLGEWARKAALDARMEEQGFSAGEKQSAKEAVGAQPAAAPEPAGANAVDDAHALYDRLTADRGMSVADVGAAMAPLAALSRDDLAEVSRRAGYTPGARDSKAKILERLSRNLSGIKLDQQRQDRINPPAGKNAEPTPANVAAETADAVHDGLAGEFANLKMVPISAIRAHLAEKMPGASKEQIDDALLALRRNKQLRLVAADDERPGELHANGVRAVGQNFIYAEPDQNMPRPRAATERPGGAPKGTAAAPEEQEKTLLGALKKQNTVGTMSPVHQMRADYMAAHPDATQKDFADAMLRLRRDGKVRLISIDDRSRATPEQLKNSVFANGETYFYAEPTDGTPAAPKPAPTSADAPTTPSVDVADVYSRSGRDAKHSELNAAMRAAAGMSKKEAGDVLRGMGQKPGADPRRDLADMIYNRFNARARQFLMKGDAQRSDAERAEYAAHRARNDEPLLKPDEAFAAAPPAPKPAPRTSKPVNVSDYQEVRPVDMATGKPGDKIGGGEHAPPVGGATLLRTSSFREPVVRVPYEAPDGTVKRMDIPEGKFRQMHRDLTAAGLDPATHLPAALAAGHAADSPSADRVSSYLAARAPQPPDAPSSAGASTPADDAPQDMGTHAASGLAFAVGADGTVEVRGKTAQHAAALKRAGFKFVDPSADDAGDAPFRPGYKPVKHWVGTLDHAVNLDVPRAHDLPAHLGVSVKNKVSGRRVVTGRPRTGADDAKPTADEFAAASQPAATKPAKVGAPPAVAKLKSDPLADQKHLSALADAATDPDAKEYLLAAAWNVDTGETLDPAANRRRTLDQLGSVWRQSHDAGKAGPTAELERHLAALGATARGKVGDTAPYDGRYFEGGHRGVFHGDPMRIVRPPVVHVNENGKEYVAVKGQLAPLGAQQSGANPK